MSKENFDPCIGDEDASTPRLDLPDHGEAKPSPISPSAHSMPQRESNLHREKGKGSAIRTNLSQRSMFELPDCLRWIPENWTISKWRPAIRCAVTEWASLLLLVINPSMRAMGQVC